MTYDTDKFDVAAAMERDFGGGERKVVKLPEYVTKGVSYGKNCKDQNAGFIWPEPKKIRSEIPEAPELPVDDIPRVMRDYAKDIAFRMQCPIDFVVIPMIVSVAGLIGKKVKIRPKQKDTWEERACLWGG